MQDANVPIEELRTMGGWKNQEHVITQTHYLKQTSRACLLVASGRSKDEDYIDAWHDKYHECTRMFCGEDEPRRPFHWATATAVQELRSTGKHQAASFVELLQYLRVILVQGMMYRVEHCTKGRVISTGDDLFGSIYTHELFNSIDFRRKAQEIADP
jgi:hypothetical protein